MFVRKRSVVLSLVPILWGVFAFCQADLASIDRADHLGEENMQLVRDKQIFAIPTFTITEHSAEDSAPPTQEVLPRQGFDLDLPDGGSPETPGNKPVEHSSRPDEILRESKPADFNREIYYRNKLEFSLDVGWHPINIPFPLDVFVGDNYNTYPLKYTLVPILASLRWQMNGLGGPWILRGNWDATFTGSITAIPRGPESRYFAYLMGIRRNFVPRNSRIAPYWDVRLGVGNIDAKGPLGVKYAQGQDLTFTVNMGSGVRYNLGPRYAISAGLNFMHISNLDLSESNGKPNWGVRNYGINVYGPMVGLDIQLRRPRREPQ